MPTTDVVTAYLTAKAASGKAAQTIAGYRRVLTDFAGCVPSLPASAEDVEAWLLGQRERCMESTRHKNCRILVTFLKWAEARHGLPSPMASVQRPRNVESVPRWYELDELAKALFHPNLLNRDRALLFLLSETGMRIGEAASITKPCLHDGYVTVAGKTGPRPVPVSRLVLGMLRDLWTPGGDALWWGRKGRLTESGLQQIVRAAMRQAGLTGPRIGPHTLRHTFATLWEGNESDLQLIGGWRDQRSVMRYRHYRLARAQAQLAEYSPVQLAMRRLAAPERSRVPNK